MSEKIETKLDPRVKRTRKLMQHALAELLGEKEFNKISVQDITGRAEVNRATFYAHFNDKYELLNAYVRETFQGMLDGKLPDLPTFTLDNLRILTLAACEYIRGFRGRCTASTQHPDEIIMLRQVQVYIHEVVLMWLRNSMHAVQHQTSLEIVATVTSSAIFGAVFEWAHNGRKLSPEQLTDQVLYTLTSGLQSYLYVETSTR